MSAHNHKVNSIIKENGKYFINIGPIGFLGTFKLEEVTKEEYDKTLKAMRRPIQILNPESDGDEIYYDADRPESHSKNEITK